MLNAGFWFATTMLLLVAQRAFGCDPTNESDRSGSGCATSDCTYSCVRNVAPDFPTRTAPPLSRRRPGVPIRISIVTLPHTQWNILVPETTSVNGPPWIGDAPATGLSLLSGHISPPERWTIQRFAPGTF
jgi:hypothetical protein